MKKRSIITSLLLLALFEIGTASAQNSFNSPYSQYGIGESNMPFNMPYACGMGGVVFSRSATNSINPSNPASYAAVETESFVFDMGVNLQSCTLRDNSQTLNDADGTIAYLAVAFPITKWWKTSLGLMPFSTVGYQSVQQDNDPNNLGYKKMSTTYDGNGGVSQLYWGNAFNLGKRLSAGFNINYLYGSITRAITYDFSQGDTTYFMNSRRQKDTYVRNVLLDFGIQYRQPLNENYTLNFGLVCKPQQTLTVSDEAMIYTFVNNNGAEYLTDTIFPARGNSNTYESSLEQPLTLGFGLALMRNERWQVAADFTYAPWAGLKYTENSEYNLFGLSSIQYDNNYYRVALGGEWMGIADANSYWSRIGVRVGVHYESGRLSLALSDGNYLLNEAGAGVGFAFPMRKGKSVLNLSFGYSSFGTADLLRRDCFTVGLSIGSCERWFVKRKYN